MLALAADLVTCWRTWIASLNRSSLTYCYNLCNNSFLTYCHNLCNKNAVHILHPPYSSLHHSKVSYLQHKHTSPRQVDHHGLYHSKLLQCKQATMPIHSRLISFSREPSKCLGRSYPHRYRHGCKLWRLYLAVLDPILEDLETARPNRRENRR